MANPNASGRVRNAATFVQIFGEDKAFQLLKAMHKNTNNYRAPAWVRSTARRARRDGIAHVPSRWRRRNRGRFAIKLVVPCEGTGYEIGSMSIIKGAKNLDNARSSTTGRSRRRRRDQRRLRTTRRRRTKATPAPPGAPDLGEIKLINYDSPNTAARPKEERILEKWDKGVYSIPRADRVSVDDVTRSFGASRATPARSRAVSGCACGAVELKGPQDFVSVADREVETFIRAEIARAFPGDHFLGDETAASFTGNAERLWVVDPIDGTHNFLRGIAYWNVSIAYVEDGVRTLGAVHDPVRDELFHVRRGAGAWRAGLDGEARIATADTAAVAGAMIAVGHSDRAPEPRYLELRRALMEANAAFRSFGSAALQLAHVADGRLDGYVEFELLVGRDGGAAAGRGSGRPRRAVPGRGRLTVKAPWWRPLRGSSARCRHSMQQATAGG
jgi:fructose-1,6-bisphosphatase/inositol monophosphatase family enzyme